MTSGRRRFIAFLRLLMVAAALAAPATVAAQPARATRPKVTPPRGAARQVMFKYCTSCHGIDDYAYNALDRAAWDAYLTDKHRTQDVPLPAEDRAVLLDWLAMRFGPDTKPFPRRYVPPEITTFLSDAEAETLVGRACASCHTAEKVKDARFSPDRWRVVAVDMRERGARLTDTELERLVEWLGRTKGNNDSER